MRPSSAVWRGCHWLRSLQPENQLPVLLSSWVSVLCGFLSLCFKNNFSTEVFSKDHTHAHQRHFRHLTHHTTKQQKEHRKRHRGYRKENKSWAALLHSLQDAHLKPRVQLQYCVSLYHLDAARLNKCRQEGKPSCHCRVDDSIGRSIIKGLRIRQTTGRPSDCWKRKVFKT